jgi:hypothetical protein
VADNLILCNCLKTGSVSMILFFTYFFSDVSAPLPGAVRRVCRARPPLSRHCVERSYTAIRNTVPRAPDCRVATLLPVTGRDDCAERGNCLCGRQSASAGLLITMKFCPSESFANPKLLFFYPPDAFDSLSHHLQGLAFMEFLSLNS